jgi:pilus assembly protein CpaB
MARIRIFLVLALALTAGGAFAFGTYRYVQQTPAAVNGLPTKPVIVAAGNLQLGAELKPEDVRIVEWPASAVPPSSFDSADQVVGRGLIAAVVENEPILSAKLASKEMGVGLPPIIPEGMRAVSVRVDDVVGVAGYVLPGTRVDVVATVNPTQQQTDVTSKVILANVLVLASGTKIEQDTEKGKPLAVSVVTLLVDPVESERLALASTEGKIQLALRNPVDKTAPATSGVRPAALLGYAAARPAPAPRPRVIAKAAPAPAPVAVAAPPPPPTVEIIRGDKRAQEVVTQE